MQIHINAHNHPHTHPHTAPYSCSHLFLKAILDLAVLIIETTTRTENKLISTHINRRWVGSEVALEKADGMAVLR